MSNLEEIRQICQALAEQGKTPTVAMVRNRAAQALTIPQVIKGLQQWKLNPQVSVKRPSPDKPTVNTPQSLEARVVQLENQVLALQTALTELQAKLVK